MRGYSIVVEDLTVIGPNRARWEVRGPSGTLLAAGVVELEDYAEPFPKQLDAAFERAWHLAQETRRELLAREVSS